MNSFEPERFPDLQHVLQLRERLWARRPRGRAAVMVGAGFSLNAEPRVAGSASFPLWSDLTARMLDELRPLLPAEKRTEELTQYASGSGSLTLAREYELTFGRAALEELLLTLLPDRNYSPGELHQHLLALPWADVFTTNYDTLLERTPPGEEGRYYDVVVQPSDLPGTTPPRIVKLHGSMPATRPFIITDEDFRRYPRDFAPFVNTVQQSMMENDFVLIGFSGDDPNFLAWLGWVRDELRLLRPRVYLCGVLDMSNARRLLLRERGVTVIDLGPLFPTNPAATKLTRGQRTERSQRALAWLLASLRNGQTLEPPLNWPRPPARPQQTSPPLELPPLAAPGTRRDVALTRFTRVPRWPANQSAQAYDAAALAELRQVLDEWQREREEYPGWLALPRRNQQLLLQRTRELRAPLVDWVATLVPAERLRPITELLWRLHKGAQLLYIREFTLGQEALAAVPLPDDPDQQQQWATLALLLLQDLRRSYDHVEFEALLARLESLGERRPHYAAERCWQAALACLERLDQAGARRWLQQWPAVPTDPAWDLRRAGLWAELDDLEAAERYVLAALQTALQLQPRLTVRIDMLDVEAAARVLLRQIQAAQRNRAGWTEAAGRRPASSPSGPGWGELARQKLYAEYRCDTSIDIEQATAELSREEPLMQQARYERIDPYSGVRSRFRTSRGGLDLAAYQPAFAVLDAHEHRGQPFWFAHGQYERLELAGQWLLTIALPRALGVVVRSGNEALLERIDKAAWATLGDERLLPLLQQTVVIGEEVFPSAASPLYPPAHPSPYALRRVGFALRLLGRAAFRLDAPTGTHQPPEELRGRAVQLAWRVWTHWVDRPLTQREVFTEFTEGLAAVLRPDELVAHVALLIAAAPEPQYTASALALVPRELFPADRPVTEEVTRAIATCLDWLSRPTGSSERRAGRRRLLYLHQLGWLQEAEQATLAAHLWTSVTGTDELPVLGEDLLSWAVLLLPAPAAVDAPARLKAYYLTQLQSLFSPIEEGAVTSPSQAVHLEQVLQDIPNATRPAPDNLVAPERAPRQWLTWTPDEARQLLTWTEQLLQTRLAEEAATGRPRELVDWTSVEEECRYLGALLADVILPALPLDDEAAAGRVYACATQLLAAKLPSRPVLPLLLPRLPQQAELASSAATSIRVALLDPADADLVQDGAEAFGRWAYAAYQHHLPAPPSDLFTEFILRTRMPELPNLLAVLTCATNLLTLAPHLLWPAYAPALGDTLITLLAATGLPTMRERNLARSAGEQERLYQRPRVREQVARLAGQLTWLQMQLPSEAGSLLTAMADWETDASQDDFVEVRRAWQAGNTDAVMQQRWATGIPTSNNSSANDAT